MKRLRLAVLRRALPYVVPVLLGVAGGALADQFLNGGVDGAILTYRVLLVGAVVCCTWLAAEVTRKNRALANLNRTLEAARLALADREPAKVVNLNSRRGAR